MKVGQSVFGHREHLMTQQSSFVPVILFFQAFFSQLLKLRSNSSSETQGQIVGPKTKIKTGGNKFDEQKYERKIRALGDKLFTHQFQTAEGVLAPDWAENFSAQSGASIRSAVWNWCVKSLSPGARIFLSYFCSSNLFPPVLIFVFGPTICPWVSEDGSNCEDLSSI